MTRWGAREGVAGLLAASALFLGFFDPRDRTLCYSNAGHNPAMIVGRGGAVKLSDGGLPLGIMETVRYEEGHCVVEPGDLLLLYTDGAVEAADPDGREFGLDRLVDFIQRRRDFLDLPTLIQETLDELSGWTRESAQQDDITLVVARAVA